MSIFLPDGYCGLYCGSCPDYLATRAGNADKPGVSVCRGCKSDVTAPWCTDCSLKECASSRGIEFCSECPEYPCPTFTDFIDNAKDPYVVEITEYLTTIKEVGTEEWLKRMVKRWSCQSCGTEASWWDLTCENCKMPLRGYAKPCEED